jgi:hypothetical protein
MAVAGKFYFTVNNKSYKERIQAKHEKALHLGIYF